MFNQTKFVFEMKYSRYFFAALVSTVFNQSLSAQELVQAKLSSITIPSAVPACGPILLSSGIESAPIADHESLTTKLPVIKQLPMMVDQDVDVLEASSLTVLAALTDTTRDSDEDSELKDEKSFSKDDNRNGPDRRTERGGEQRAALKRDWQENQNKREKGREQNVEVEEERSSDKRKRQKDIAEQPDKRRFDPPNMKNERRPKPQPRPRQPMQLQFPGRLPSPDIQPPFQTPAANSAASNSRIQFDVVSHPVFKQMIELMKENFELRAKLEVQQVELKSERALAELKLNHQREHLQEIEQRLAERMKEFSRFESEVKEKTAKDRPHDNKAIDELETVIEKQAQEIAKLKKSLMEAKEIVETERQHAEQARDALKELEEVQEALEDCQDNLKKSKNKK